MNKWISVKDRMPQHGDEVIVFDGKDVESGVRYSKDFGFKYFDYGYSTGVTHWMPLPEPPK